MAQLEAELARLRDKMSEQLEEYANLMDIKTSLDLEIATYRALLEGEEDRYRQIDNVFFYSCFSSYNIFYKFSYRLNLTPNSPSESMQSKSVSGIRRGTPVRTARKRMLLDESEERSLHDYSVTSSAKGDIEISEVCQDGTFIKLHNKGKKVQSHFC